LKQEHKKIAVKNMVCNRCIKVVKDELQKNGINYHEVTLGTITFNAEVSNEQKEVLNKILRKEGFEILKDKEAIIVNKIKTLVIKNIHQGKEKPQHQNFSDYLTSNIGIDYSHMSKLFSELEGKTIEHFIIEQRIERAKEFIMYNELTLSQISYELNYSSPQHLSRQFKQITGLTPTEFKNIGQRKKLDNI
jgi:AraC-like DNA-binding protein